MIYSQELKDRTFKAYEEDVSNGVVRQRELEEKVLMYYRRTTPSLQEYYSRYTPEWELSILRNICRIWHSCNT